MISKNILLAYVLCLILILVPACSPQQSGLTAQPSAGEEQVRTEVSAMLADARMVLDSAATALSKARPGKDNKAELELMKSELAGLNTSYTEAQGKFDSGAYLESQLQLTVVVEKARNMTSQLAAAKR